MFDCPGCVLIPFYPIVTKLCESLKSKLLKSKLKLNELNEKTLNFEVLG